MYDFEITLIKKSYDVNDVGDSIPQETLRVVLCDRRSVTRTEHYAAAAQSLRPEDIFVLNRYDYDGEAEAIFENKRYSVLRVYEPKKSKGIEDFESIELVCAGAV